MIICLTRGDDVVAVHALDMVGAGVAMAPASGPAARSGLLRLPGSVLRRLPVVVVPDPGESLGSWVDRVAARAEVPPGQAAVALGLEIRGRGSGVLPVLYGITLTAASRAGLAASTGLDPVRCEAMTLSVFDGAALDFTGLDPSDERSVQRLARREWALLRASRACPTCLAETGGVWPLWWRLGVAAVCPRHRVLLVDFCPACRIRLRKGQANRSTRLWGRRCVDPLRCDNSPEAGRWCPYWLTDLATVAVSPALVRAQHGVLAVAEGTDVRVGGQPVTARMWFAFLRFVTGLVRLAAMVEFVSSCPQVPAEAVDAFVADCAERAGARGSRAALRAMPATAPLAAAMLAVATPILFASDRDECLGALAPLVRAAATARRVDIFHQLRREGLPGPLTSLLEEVMPRPARVHGARVRQRAREGGVRWEIPHLPHLVQADDFRDLVAAHLSSTGERIGRRLAALALARLAGAESWRHAVAAMDMAPMWLDLDVVSRIRDSGGFWASTAAVGERMTSRGLVDYAARRRATAGLLEVPYRVVKPTYRPLHIAVTEAKCRYAAVWVWTTFTGGDFCEAPGLITAAGEPGGPETRYAYRQFVSRMPEDLAGVLRAWGASYLADRGVA